MKRRLNLLREFSVPLIGGVIVALAWANLAPEQYEAAIHGPLLGTLSLHFLTNDIFMVFFFGIAAAEITQSCLPGGDLNPPRKALNPLFATVGGVVGPALTYAVLNRLFGSPALAGGWGIPTATDIALAWLAARLVFGRNHPVIAYLLLLAIADDAVGLAIIALFYPNPLHPVSPGWLALTAAGMGVALVLQRRRVRSYWPYLLAGGVPSWVGLFHSQLHPSLALVFIVPFLPHPLREHRHLFEEDPKDHSTLACFEHEWKVFVDFGLFLFGLANAGVRLEAVGEGTWLVLASLLVGKTGGIFAFGLFAMALGFPLPAGVQKRALLHVSREPFRDMMQGQTEKEVMLRIAAAAVAWAAGKPL